MSMYEMLFPGAAPALAAQTLAQMGIPDGGYRLRDTWIEKHGDELVVRIVTRLGGGNRSDYRDEIAELTQHPRYVTDHDETEWDRTYASFYFRLPPNLPDIARDMFELAAEPVPINMKERADQALEEAKARWAKKEFTPAESELISKLTGGGGGGIIEV